MMQKSFFMKSFLILVLIAAASCYNESPPLAAPPENGVQDFSVVTELIFIVRVKGKGENISLKVPLPLSGENIFVIEEEFRLRGFTMEESIEDGIRIANLSIPALEGRRRFTYKALLGLNPVEYRVEKSQFPSDFPQELRKYTLPTPSIQSRSPLVREKLIENLEPRLKAGENDLPRMIYGLVSGSFERNSADGTSNVLRAIREKHANDRGLDRLLITFMRASRIPARSVTGFKLRTDGGRKLERWTEIYIGEEWVPVSVPGNWYGSRPARYLPLSHGDRRLIEREGVESLTFKVLVRDPVQSPLNGNDHADILQ